MNLLRNCKSLTLLELLLAIVLLSVIVIGLTSIDLFSRFHVVTANRRTVIQNEVSYALEHMSREISRAIGNINQPPITIWEAGNRIVVYIDFNNNGRRDPVPPDRRVAYRYRPITAPVAQRNRIWYCPQCVDAACTTCNPPWFNAQNLLSRNISAFQPIYNPNNNFIEILPTARWNPAQAASLDNPEVTMRARIKMPSVSTN